MVYAYDITPGLSFGLRDPDKEFPLAPENDSPQGIWSDGNTVFVADSVDDKIYAYVPPQGSLD